MLVDGEAIAMRNVAEVDRRPSARGARSGMPSYYLVAEVDRRRVLWARAGRHHTSWSELGLRADAALHAAEGISEGVSAHWGLVAATTTAATTTALA